MFLIDDRTFAIHRALAQRKYSTWLSPADLARMVVPGRLRMAAVVTAESLARSEYDELARIVDGQVRNNYGATEAAELSFECDHGRHHLNSDWLILEPVDADYQPSPPGEASHTVLLTNLANRVQPIIRYDLGESIEPLAHYCSRGSPLPAFRVQGGPRRS